MEKVKRFDVALRKDNAVFVEKEEGPAVSYADYEKLQNSCNLLQGNYDGMKDNYRFALEALLKATEFMESVVRTNKYAIEEQRMVRETKTVVAELLAAL